MFSMRPISIQRYCEKYGVAAAALLALLGSSLPSEAAQAGAKWSVTAASSQGTVEFLAIGRPSALKIRGKASGAVGSFKVDGLSASGEASFKLEGLDTGIGMRTQHMKEKYLEIAKYPEAKLVLTSVAISPDFLVKESKADAVAFQGKLTLHGVEKPVNGKVTLERKDKDTLSVNAQFGLKITDYGIAQPGYMGITMAEDVDVSVQFAAPIQMQSL